MALTRSRAVKQVPFLHRNPLNEETLRRLERNDPGVAHLAIEENNWIQGAGHAIGNNIFLVRIEITVSNSENHQDDGRWLDELCRGLARNRSIRALKLSVNFGSTDVDIFHILLPFFEHNSNLYRIEVERLGIEMLSQRMTNSLASALSKSKLRMVAFISLQTSDEKTAALFDSLNGLQSLLELHAVNIYVQPMGCMALANLLTNPACKIHTLGFYHVGFDVYTVAIIRDALIWNESVTNLNLSGSRVVTTQGWCTFSALFSHPMSSLERFELMSTSMDDVGITRLGDSLAVNTTVKSLVLSKNTNITSAGWQSFVKCINNPYSALEVLVIKESNVDEETVVAIASALAENVRLKKLFINNLGEFTDRVWEILSSLLCDKTSFERTYASNHTLRTIGIYSGDTEDEESFYYLFTDRISFSYPSSQSDVLDSLMTNLNKDKAEIVREKILKHHFSGDGSTEDIHVFACMPEYMLPCAMEWIGRDHLEFSMMYNLVRAAIKTL